MLCSINRTKTCRVCGDVAHGFNFSGLSCGSCKSFFRRCVINQKEYKCQSEQNNCPIDKSTRNLCQKCRMDKCIAIGMKKQLVNYKFIIRTKFCQIPKALTESIELQTYDLLRIGEINNAMHIFPNEHHLPLVGQSTDLVYLVNQTEHYARRTIQFCKRLESFRLLQCSDQIQLLKLFYPEMSAIQMSFIYMADKDAVRVLNETGRETILVQMKISNDPNVIDAYTFQRFARPLLHVMQNDTTIRNLIFALLLFKPRDYNTNCREFVKYNHTVYCHLLQKYIRCKFRSTGEQKFASLMATLGQIGETSRLYCNFFRNSFVPNELHEIVRDIYDI